ncbi:hypothetical protein [Syntrophomonas wolfei]
MPDRYKAAFICVHNSCRSQMAEAYITLASTTIRWGWNNTLSLSEV